MKVLDLFSGIGGFSLGLELAGMQTVAFCEKDKYCQKVLNKHWPDVTIFEDIHDVTNESLSRRGVGSIDLISGGFPCQPFSVAGQRRGKDDDRYLWPAMFKIISDVKPTWVLCENVTGIINLALDTIISDLENDAYSTQTFIIPASAINAPHRRDRIWILAHSTSKRLERPTRKSIQRGINGFADNGQDVPNSKSKRILRKLGDYTETEIKNWSQANKFNILHTDSTNPDWSIESPFCGVANGIPRRMDRLRGLGNAVVPQIVEQLGKCIIHSQGELWD